MATQMMATVTQHREKETARVDLMPPPASLHLLKRAEHPTKENSRLARKLQMINQNHLFHSKKICKQDSFNLGRDLPTICQIAL